MSIRGFFTMIVWGAVGLAMFWLGFYVGTRQQHSAALIQGAREAMKLQAFAEKHGDRELARYADDSLTSYRTALDAYTNGRGLNPEHRQAVLEAQNEIAHFLSTRRETFTTPHP